jgi:hypothetical protein
MEGPITRSRIDSVRQQGGLLARFTRQPKNRSKCEPTLPGPLGESDRSSVLTGQAPSGYVVVPINLQGPITNGNTYTNVAAGSSRMIMPGAKGYIVSFGWIVPTVVESVEAGQANVSIDKVNVKPGTLGMAMAANAKIAIPVGVCR